MFQSKPSRHGRNNIFLSHLSIVFFLILFVPAYTFSIHPTIKYLPYTLGLRSLSSASCFRILIFSPKNCFVSSFDSLCNILPRLFRSFKQFFVIKECGIIRGMVNILQYVLIHEPVQHQTPNIIPIP